jgi:hypothetical protein
MDLLTFSELEDRAGFVSNNHVVPSAPDSKPNLVVAKPVLPTLSCRFKNGGSVKEDEKKTFEISSPKPVVEGVGMGGITPHPQSQSPYFPANPWIFHLKTT